ncbi:MAG: ABC transporter permease [Candidatus Delongbacteria bacterium]|nr:ABC transporter permease [Candidatus Delongbacteria bacterium]
MSANFELFIARRYYLSKRKIGFISVITYIATLGIILGVAVLNIVLSVMNGFEEIVKEKIVGAISHIQVTSYHNEGIGNYLALTDSILKFPEVIGAAPLVFERAAVQSEEGLDALIVNGIDTARIDQVADIRKYLYGGYLDLGDQIEPVSGDTLPGIVLGYDLAERLRVVVGGKVLIAGFKEANLTSRMMPKLKRCLVTGIFKSGFYDYDAAFGYVSIPTAQDLFHLEGKVNQIDIRIRDMYQAQSVAKRLEDSLKYPYYTMNWIERNQKLFTWIKLEKSMMFVILNLIVVVAVFNIISALIMLVLNKTREIGIMRAMGATRRNIMKIFILDGITAGLIGAFGGTLLSLLVCWIQMRYKLITIPADLYTIDSLPIRIVGWDFLIVGLSALFLSFLATLYPSLKAANQNTVEALVYE